MMMRYHGPLAIAAAAVIAATAVLLLPAEARVKKKQKQYRVPAISPSLDGRNTGRARTCGHEAFVYDGWGVPMGPYCQGGAADRRLGDQTSAAVLVPK